MNGARFQAGAGVAPETLREAITGLAGLAVVFFAVYASYGSYERWRGGELDSLGFWTALIRAVVLALLLFNLLRTHA
jgi:integrating conjugative element protein (TIGR03758 family)